MQVLAKHLKHPLQPVASSIRNTLYDSLYHVHSQTQSHYQCSIPNLSNAETVHYSYSNRWSSSVMYGGERKLDLRSFSNTEDIALSLFLDHCSSDRAKAVQASEECDDMWLRSSICAEWMCQTDTWSYPGNWATASVGGHARKKRKLDADQNASRIPMASSKRQQDGCRSLRREPH